MPRGRPEGRNISGSLPSNPRARSAGHHDGRERENKEYKPRTRDNGYHSNRDTGTSTRAPPTRSVRPQRSLANITPSRGESSRPSSYANTPEVPPLPLYRRSDASYQSGTSSGSHSSVSGSSSTFLDRMKNRREGYESSRTSLEEEDPPPKVMGTERGGWFNQRNAAKPEPEYGTFMELELLLRCVHVTGDLGEADDRNEMPVQPGYGLSLWSRVATAASTLTISASKAWESNIVAYSGERTSFALSSSDVGEIILIGILNHGMQIHHRARNHALRSP